jgi:hypothetical protein
MDAKIFERCFIWVVCKKAEEFNPPLNDSWLSADAFDVGHPVNAWRSTRNSSRGLSLQEAYRLAEKLNISFESLCWDVANELRNGWTMEKDVALMKPSPGRPSRNSQKKEQEKGTDKPVSSSWPVPDNRLRTDDN